MRTEIQKILSRGCALAADLDECRCEEAAAVLEQLMEANRTCRGQERNPARLTDAVRKETAEHGQHPKAVVVCCADSRVPPEHIFGAGIGDLFVIRNAGNLMGPFDAGSVEYAVEHLHVPLVLVMGHRNCGAVASALSHAEAAGDLAAVLAEVTLAIGDASNPAEAEERNLIHSLSRLRESELLRQFARAGKVGFAAAIYDIRTGAVRFLSE